LLGLISLKLKKNDKMIQISPKRSVEILLIALVAISGKIYSQSSSFGNTYLFNSSEMAIVNIQHNFLNGGSGIQPGLVGTDRTATQGFLSFVGTASWTGASNSAFVDGYVKTYRTSAFTFPIGDNSKYRPAAISSATLINPANAAYYGVSASIAITTRLRGGNEPVLPASGPFNTGLMGAGVLSVNNVEYWDINGATSAKITLTWDATSAVTSLSSLGILGWNGSQWVAIPANVDSISILGDPSNLTSGSITTIAAIVPNTYEIYTLGKVCGSGTSAPVLSGTNLVNVCPSTSVNLNSLVTSSTPSAATLVWFTNNTHTGTAYTTPETTDTGIYYSFYYDSVNNCYSSVGASVNVTINSPSTPTAASTTQPTCTVPTGTIVFTTQSGVEYSVNNGTTYQASATFSGLATGIYTLKVRSTIDVTCSKSAESTVTLVSPIPTTAGTLSSNQAICSGSAPSDLTLSGNIGNVLKWQKSSDTAFTSPVDITNTVTTLTGSNIGNLTTTTYFRALVQNGSCTVVNSNYVTITISATTWNGNAWSNGVPIITTTAFMTGNYSEAVDIFACTLTVSNSAIVSIPSGYDVTLNGKLTVEAGSSFTLNNNSNLLQQTNVSNIGDISVKRMSSPMYRLDYNLWSSPVISTKKLFDFSPLTSNISPTNIRFYTYNTITNQYNSVNPITTSFDTAKSYLIRSPNNWLSYNSNLSPAPLKWTGTFTGVPRNGNVSFTMENTGSNTAINATGNPYPSALLMNNFISDNSSTIEGTLWFWRKFNENNNLVSYSTCTMIGCTLNNNATYTNTNLISIGQGFMVKAKAGQTNLNFTNSMRSSENVDQFFKSSNTQMDRYWIKMINSTNNSAGQNLIAYIPNATYDYDTGLDGLYSNDSSIAFYTKAGPQDVVINARPSFMVNDVIPILFKTNVADTYTFSLLQKEGIFDGSQDVLLRDNYANSIQNLTLGEYSFSTAIGTFTDRFDIIYQNQLNNTNPSVNANQIIIYNKDQAAFINSGEIIMHSIKIFDIRGRLLYQKSDINDTKYSIKLDVANEVLLFQITTQNGEIITKKNVK
jgi:hypothetical protein